MNRLTSLEGGEEKSGVPWAEFDPKSFDQDSWRERWKRTMHDAPVFLCAIQAGVFRCALENLTRKELIQALCGSRDSQWLRVLNQVSPNGSGGVDDLALAPLSETHPSSGVASPEVASSDTELSATIVLLREGENFHLYRRLYAP